MINHTVLKITNSITSDHSGLLLKLDIETDLKKQNSDEWYTLITYINNLHNCDINTKFILFADDTVALNSDSSETHLTALTKNMNSAISDWFLTNKLRMNITNTSYRY